MAYKIDDSLFGTDYSSKGELTSTGDISLVSGIDNAKQNIKNWLSTDKGFYPSIDEDYGSEISEVLGWDNIENHTSALILCIENALYDNPRVQRILEITPYQTVKDTIIMQVTVELVNGQTDNFTLNIGE